MLNACSIRSVVSRSSRCARLGATLAALSVVPARAAAQICLEYPSHLGDHFARAVTAADFDGDGRPDLAVVESENDRVALWRNLGGGSFAGPTLLQTGSMPWGIDAADLDADGDLDLVAAKYSTNGVDVFLNTGSGTFSPPVPYAAISGGGCIAIGDLDGDGDPDLVGGSSLLGVLLNQGNGTFVPGASILSGVHPSRIAIADLDGDGDLDLVVSDSFLTALAVLRNNGNGTFASWQTLDVGGAQGSVVAVDLDGDGDIDLATSTTVGGHLYTFLNPGTGNFGSPVSPGAGGGAQGLLAVDLDGDGDPDLVQENLHVYENLGGGWFAAPQSIPAPGLGVMAAADFDGDGDLDIAEPRNWLGGVFIVLNCRLSGTSFCPGDGSIAPCPCGNNGIPGRGCGSSAALAGGASLAAGGKRSLASDTLQFSATGLVPNALCILLQGDATIAPANFGDGLRCVGGHLKRLYAHNAGGMALSVPQLGDASISQRSAALGDTLSAGAVRGYQVYYRDPLLGFCPAPQGDSWNVSSGVSIVWHF